MSRLLVLFVLLFATALSGTADASLRAVGPAGHMVLCADGAVVTVALGADGLPAGPGDPVQPRRHCPDCLPLVMGATGAAPSVTPARPLVYPAVAPATAAFPPPVNDHAAIASPRGPPGGDPA